jgi:undecaprenyl-diphosphatase
MRLSKPVCTCLLLIPVFFALAANARASDGTSAMTMGQATVLGVVEGLTEYLPVSSTGHLLLTEWSMGMGDSPSLTTAEKEDTKEALDAYTVCIQIGAIVAVLGLYFRRVRQMWLGLMGQDSEGQQMLINVVVGFLPAAVIGLLFNKAIKAHLFGPWPVVVAWFVGGAAILAVSWQRQKSTPRARGGMAIDELTWKMALIIGFAQCIAMWPGVSRSLVTIVGGLLVGMTMSAAVEFSFLLGLITLGAATAYDGLKHGHLMLHTFSAMSLAIGVLFAFIAALLSVKWMVSYLNRHGLAIFGYYRVALAVGVALLLTR